MEALDRTKVEHGITRYKRGDRPWWQREVDWFLVTGEGELLPLKYVVGLSTDTAPAEFSTSQAKAAVRDAGFACVSMKSLATTESQFSDEVAESLRDREARAQRLATAPRKPTQHLIAQFVFRRNPDVVAEVLERAAGNCEVCKRAAPFLRAKSNQPYLEVHHLTPLAKGGEDTVENAVAACPNCHRAAHYA